MNIFESSDWSKPDLITDNLYIGTMVSAFDKSCLKELGITHILICASFIEPNFPDVNSKFMFLGFRLQAN
jgi:hypothetical protein